MVSAVAVAMDFACVFVSNAFWTTRLLWWRNSILLTLDVEMKISRKNFSYCLVRVLHSFDSKNNKKGFDSGNAFPCTACSLPSTSRQYSSLNWICEWRSEKGILLWDTYWLEKLCSDLILYFLFFHSPLRCMACYFSFKDNKVCQQYFFLFFCFVSHCFYLAFVRFNESAEPSNRMPLRHAQSTFRK